MQYVTSISPINIFSKFADLFLLFSQCDSSVLSNGLFITLKKKGPVRELNPGPLAPEARIIPLDQQATIAKAFPNDKKSII